MKPTIEEAFDGVVVTSLMTDSARQLAKHLLLTSLNPAMIEFAKSLRERADESE